MRSPKKLALAPLLVLSLIAALLAPTMIAEAAPQAQADVDGDGVPDQIEIVTDDSGVGPADLTVIRGSNQERVNVQYERSPGGFTDTMLITRDLDGLVGSEIILDAQHITTNEFIEIYSMTGGTLHLAGRFMAFGSDSAYRFGITCRVGAVSRSVVQHSFQYSFSKRRWKRTNKRYVWQGGSLVREGSAKVTKLRGKPKRRETRVNC